jgi:hypothetical protein
MQKSLVNSIQHGHHNNHITSHPLYFVYSLCVNLAIVDSWILLVPS